MKRKLRRTCSESTVMSCVRHSSASCNQISAEPCQGVNIFEHELELRLGWSGEATNLLHSASLLASLRKLPAPRQPQKNVRPRLEPTNLNGRVQVWVTGTLMQAITQAITQAMSSSTQAILLRALLPGEMRCAGKRGSAAAGRARAPSRALCGRHTHHIQPKVHLFRTDFTLHASTIAKSERLNKTE